MLDFHQQDGRFKVSDHPDVSNTLTSHMGTGGNNVPLIKAFKWSQGEKIRSLAIGEVSPTLSTDHNPAVYQIERERERVMCRADTQANAAQGFDLSPTLMAHAGKDAPFIYPTTIGETSGFHFQDSRWRSGGGKGFLGQDELSATLSTHNDQFLHTEDSMNGLTVRRLTPLECERLQGFPDGWTDIPWKGKKHAPDSPRYKALGNSMAVPVMRWIGEGIQLVEDNKGLFQENPSEQ